MPGTPAKLFGPLAVTATMTTNIYNPSANTYALLRQLHIVNKTGSAVTISLWLGATTANAAGTEVLSALSIPANSFYPVYFPSGLKITASDFLVGGAGTTTALSITGLGELYAA